MCYHDYTMGEPKEQRIYDLKVGDRVKVLDIFDDMDHLVGLEATVVEDTDLNDPDFFVGLEFDLDIYGHDCNGLAKEGCGYYLPATTRFIEKIEETDWRTQYANWKKKEEERWK